jgi:hypothetical protein
MGHASIDESSQLLGLSNGQQAGMFSSNLVGGRRRRFSRGKFKKIYKSYTKRGSRNRSRSIKKKAKIMHMGVLTKLMNKIKSLRINKNGSNKTRRRKYRGGMNSTMSGNPLASSSTDTFGKPTSCLSAV